MERLRNLRIALVAGGVLAMAVMASAQITTGSVTGNVRDGQGAVVPGASVALISETRGTQLPDVVTSAEGDFQFVNVPADRYTIQVSMSGFKTMRKTGVEVSPADRLGLGALTIEIGGVTDTVVVQAETLAIQSQSGERSFTIPTK